MWSLWKVSRRLRQSGGGGEIRTLGRVSPTTVFKTGALNRSATPPHFYSLADCGSFHSSRLLKNLRSERPSFRWADAAQERLEEKGLAASRLGEPTKERGGRAKRYFAVPPSGLETIRMTRQASTDL